MKVIPRTEVKPLLQNLNNGTIYSVTFIKKDGTRRVMNSIKGTHKGVKGVGLSFDPEKKNLIPVYDLQLARKGEPENKCWRFVNLDTVEEVCVNKEVLTVQ